MKEQVIITPVNIGKSGQLRYFQIRLPKNAKQIIGIEIGNCRINNLENISEALTSLLKEESISMDMNSTGWLSFKSNILIGELKLQSCERANIFYAADVQLDKNLGFGDYSQTTAWQAVNHSHQSKTEEDTVIVNGDSTIVQGIYKDRIGEQNKMDVQYLLNVYVWVEIESKCSTEKETAA